MAFKLGVSGVSIAEIIGLLYLGLYGVIQEYDAVPEEAIGLAMMVITTLIASAMFLVIVFYSIKWKGKSASTSSASIFTALYSVFSVSIALSLNMT